MATRVRTYRIDVDANAQKGDAIVIDENGGMTSQHLGTAASLDAGTCCGNVPVIDENGELPNSTIPSNAMKKSVYDPNNKEADVFNYNNLDNTPDIPVVNDSVVTFKQGGVTRGSISLNQAGGTEIELLAGGLEAGKGIDIYENKIDVDYDACSLCINDNSKLEVVDYSTIASGAASGATAVQPNDLATVAMSGSYCDLINKPEIPSAQIQSDWEQTNTNLPDYIKNKPTIGNATITLQKNGTDVDAFTLNQTANKCLNITLNKCDVGLNNVDNTSDVDKPVSTAVCEALSCKQDNITDLGTIRSNACAGKTASDTIATYGDIVTHDTCEFATATQGGKADTAVQSEDLCTVATSGKYCDLTGTPTIPTDNCQLANSCGYTTCTGTLVESDLQPYAKSCDLCSVATSGKYCDLTGTPTIPTDNCELANGCNYITNAVNDLANYYLKCETYTKSEVDTLIANFGGFEVVSVLPTTDIKTNVIYLLGPIGTGSDRYEEYIYYNNSWTKIGETSVDLSNYALCSDIPTDNCQLANSCGYTTCTGTLVASDLNPYAKSCTLCTIATSGKYCDLTGTPTIPTDNCQLANSCGYTTCTGTLVASDLNPYAKSCDLCSVATSGKYCDLTGAPTLCNVATSGLYSDLTGTPTLCAVATSGKYCDLSGTPSLATVATSGLYCDLQSKPTIPTKVSELSNDCNFIDKSVNNLDNYTPTNSLATVATSGAYCDLTGAPTLACVACSGSYEDLCCKPNLGVYQTTANMVCSLVGADDSHYPTAKAVSDALSCAGTGDMVSSVYDPCGCCADAFDYSKLHGTPNLCTVATSGKYCDLTGTPTIPATLNAGNGISIVTNYINVQYDNNTIKKNSGNCLYVDLSSGTGICIENNKVNAQNLFVINEDAIEVTYTDELGTAPYNACYCYTNVCINPNCGIKWIEGATYIFNLDTCVATSACRNVRLQIGSGDYIPLMGTTAIANGNSYFVKAAIRPFQYSTKYQECGALHVISDSNTTYSAMSVAEGKAGTCTACRSVRADYLKQIIQYYNPTDNCQLANGCGYTTCTGTLNSGDLVTVNGCSLVGSGNICIQSGTWGQINGTLCDQTDLQTALDGKLNKVTSTGADRAYIVNASGEQTTYNVAQGTSNGAIVRRTGTQIIVPETPTETCHAASKKYVDDHVGSQWGCITGTLCDQTDLQGVLDCKAQCCDIPDVSGKQDKATCGSVAPSSTPGYVGQQYVDTTNDKLYVATGTSSSYDWTEIGSGGGGTGDMAYADFEWATKSGASITLDLSSEITPSADFVVNKPATIKEGQTYVLRVTSGATAYTMTLGTGVGNPFNVDLSLNANETAQFVFLATDSTTLELQKMGGGGGDIEYVTEDEYEALPDSKLTNGVSYFIYE